MSKKRKKPGRHGGGRYTPPANRTPAKSTPFDSTAIDLGADADWEDDEHDDGDDDRWPVTISLPRYGNRTVPHAFATWVNDSGLLDRFDSLMCERHERGDSGDPLQAFVSGRDDVPPAVTEAIAGFDEYLDQLFGPPVE